MKSLVYQTDAVCRRACFAAAAVLTACCLPAFAAPDTLPSTQPAIIRNVDPLFAQKKVLESDPANPEANTAVGESLCFEKGDWAAGLRLLVKGSDAALREVAGRDLAVSDVAIARIVLGHDWWDYAASRQAAARVRCQERAAYWYRVALPDAPAYERSELGKRIATADADAEDYYAKAGIIRPIDLAAVALEREALGSAESEPMPAMAVSRDTTFSAGDKPYRLGGNLNVAGEKAITLTFASGLEIRGGTIDLALHGQANIKGTAEKPVIFRGVTFMQDLGASLTAEHAVFDHCKFNKGGAWYASYSSKWKFTECLLYSCAFGRLTEVDYGFQIRHCAMVSMDFPEISHEHSAGFDHMTRLRSEWNKIESCDFVDCKIPPTVAWCSENSNFRHCGFIPGEAFVSPRDLEWPASIADSVGSDPGVIWAEHPAERGLVKHVQADSAFETTHFAARSPVPEIRLEGGSVRLLAPRGTSPAGPHAPPNAPSRVMAVPK